MTDDIVTRLRDLAMKEESPWANIYDNVMREAADEIEQLRQAIYKIAGSAREHYKSGILWGAINHAVDVADEHYKNCQCGELR